MANNSPLTNVTAVLGGSNAQSGAGSSGGNSALTTQLTSITQQLQQLQTINQTQIQTLEANTAAVGQNTTTKGSGVESIVSKVGSTIEGVLGFGLGGLSPLISGLVSLFGGGTSSQPAPLVPYIAPPTVHATAGIGAGSPGAVDTGDGGLPRAVPSTGSSAGATQITVQVQALDSQSFLDHSDDIAQAVRQAMLTSTTLNDVIREV